MVFRAEPLVFPLLYLCAGPELLLKSGHKDMPRTLLSCIMH
jgi:hypothetical protein